MSTLPKISDTGWSRSLATQVSTPLLEEAKSLLSSLEGTEEAFEGLILSDSRPSQQVPGSLSYTGGDQDGGSTNQKGEPKQSNKVASLIRRMQVPSSWSVESSIQIVPPKLIDTTDRSLYKKSGQFGFDPDGYRKDKGLRRSLFYKSGYLSCTKCNGVTFIDSAALRVALDLKALFSSDFFPQQSLPPCAMCGETGGLRVGAQDFLHLIQGGQKELFRRRRLEKASVVSLQRAYRRYLGIQWGVAESGKQKTTFLLDFRSAQVIQAIMRGRLGRRIFHTERWLRVIKRAHPILVQYALKSSPDQKKVFWYKNKAEETQLYRDYVELVQRTGCRPPRMVVEDNIHEIATRVIARQAQLARRIQSRWRGFSVRRYILVFRRELKRQREVRASMAFRLQRLVRGWIHRRLARKTKSVDWGRRAMAEYKGGRDEQGCGTASKEGMQRLCAAYVLERKQEMTARLVGYTEPKLAGGNKMKAFYESAYGDDAVSVLMNQQVQGVYQQRVVKEMEELKRKERAEFVRIRQLEDPQLARYFGEEVTARNQYVINKLCSNKRPFENAGAVLKAYNRHGKRKYTFPKHVNNDPMEILKESSPTDALALLELSGQPNHTIE